MFDFFSALIAKRIAEKKEKVAAIKASHKKCVSPPISSHLCKAHVQFQGCVGAGS